MLQRSHLSLLAELWVPWKPKWGTPQKALTEHKAYKMHGGIGMGAAVDTPKSQYRHSQNRKGGTEGKMQKYAKVQTVHGMFGGR